MCLKEIRELDLRKRHEDMVEIVCMFERYFPTSIMDSQVHLLVHLVEEVSIAGPVHTRYKCINFVLHVYLMNMNSLNQLIHELIK